MRQKHFGHRLTRNDCSTKVWLHVVLKCFVRTGLVEKYVRIGTKIVKWSEMWRNTKE